MNKSDVEVKLRDALVKQVAIAHQMEGVRKLHDAALIMCNEPLVMTYRQQMHDLLDLQLDTQNEISSLTRSLVKW